MERNIFQKVVTHSVFNKPYLNMCNYDLQLSNPTVNDISITSSNDVLFKTLMGVKYIASTTTAPAGYKAIVRQAMSRYINPIMLILLDLHLKIL